ncbi:MAG: DUF3990 domain-containing protein [Clostridium sp.]|nr:DUF3990 domain-containing protein [Clostridium sp.]MCM1400117.1 DUF3990 domain-containing protein [Clostridium sp.]MCM1460804.1 DUF3990 domain-containing protein [Bacteroides sp.]
MSKKKILYHGSKEIVATPEIRVQKYNKDFYFGFYCTVYSEQAKRWATRFDGIGYLNEYQYIPNNKLNVKIFSEMTEEWLDFIVACRMGKSHNYDIVEGPMADDTIFNYVQNFVDGKISREAFWSLVKFKNPTHQISFHTENALATLEFLKGSEVRDEE